MIIIGLSPVFVILMCLIFWIRLGKGWYAALKRDDSTGLLIKSESSAFYKKKLGVSADQSLVLFCHFCGENAKIEQCQSCGNFNCWHIWDRQFCCTRCDTRVGSVNCAYCGKENAAVNILLLQNPRIELAQAVQPWKLWYGSIMFILISGGLMAVVSYNHLVNEKPTLAFNGYGAEVLVGSISVLMLLIVARWVSKNLYLRKNLMKYAAEWEGNVSEKNPSKVKKLASGFTASVGLASSFTGRAKKPLGALIKAVRGEYDDAEVQRQPNDTSKNVSSNDTIWLQKTDGNIGGPYTKEKLRQLKRAGKLPPGLKASRSKDGPWKELPTG